MLPPVFAAGVPASVAVPSPLSVNVTPGGSAPVSDNVELGTPLVVTVKVPAWPAVKVVPAGLVIPGAWLTVRVKLWVASGMTSFVALIVNGYVPPVFAAGVPASVAVPFLLSVNVTPDGSVSGAGKMHVGYPVVVTVKVPAWPTAKVATAVLVIWHAWSTVKAPDARCSLGAAREAALVTLGRRGRFPSLAWSLPRGRDPCFSSVRRRAPCAIWRVAAAARTAPVALCVAIDPGRRADASAACAWLSDPKATANMARTNTSFLCIDSVPEVHTDRRPGQRAVALNGPGDLSPG